jgi:acyl-CoA synthetase (AMP-forming)/AMP-acid ligase II
MFLPPIATRVHVHLCAAWQATTPAELTAHARNLLSHYKTPRLVLFRPLPRTATGKIQKHVLRRQLRKEGVAGPGRSSGADNDAAAAAAAAS